MATGSPASRSSAALRSSRLPLVEIAIALLALAGSAAAALRGREPFATWFYLFAWYATLLALDGIAALGGRRPSRLTQPAHLATLMAWSAVTWLFFELLNLRLRNWFYVFVPADPVARRIGVLLAFATVFPAVFGAEAALERLGLAREARWPRLAITPRLLRALRLAGAVSLALPLLVPDLFFPLVWVALTLLLEPGNWRRDPARSLLGDLERGEPGRLLRLLAGGLIMGLLWELYNVGARSRWIYTVPGFEDWRLFEMPLAGFLGFPPFALECFAIWQALVLAGLAAPLRQASGATRARGEPPSAGRPARARFGTRALAGAGALALSAIALDGMERRTVVSFQPELAGLHGLPAASLARAGYDVFSLARADAGRLAAVTGGRPAEAATWIERARLVVLAGIGTLNARRLEAAGVSSVAELAAADPVLLAERLRTDGGRQIADRVVRLWVRRAARSEA